LGHFLPFEVLLGGLGLLKETLWIFLIFLALLHRQLGLHLLRLFWGLRIGRSELLRRQTVLDNLVYILALIAARGLVVGLNEPEVDHVDGGEVALGLVLL